MINHAKFTVCVLNYPDNVMSFTSPFVLMRFCSFFPRCESIRKWSLQIQSLLCGVSVAEVVHPNQ